MDAVAVVLSTLLGLIAGPAVDVIVHQVPRKLPVTLPPRRPPDCPVHTRTRILAAALLGGAALRFGWSWTLPAYLVLFAALLAISLVDLEHYIIPNRILYPTGFVTLPLLAVASAADGGWEAFTRALTAAAVAFGLFLMLFVISPRGMGFGDVRLSFLLGLHVGWLGWGELALAMFVSFISNAVVGIGAVALKRRTIKGALPFGPFLAAGAVLAILVGEPVLDWYSG